MKLANFRQIQSDNAGFIKRINGSKVVILAYADDLLFLGSTTAVLKQATSELLAHFDGSVKPLEWYLGVYFSSKFNSFQLTKKSYIQHALTEFGLNNVKT